MSPKKPLILIVLIMISISAQAEEEGFQVEVDPAVYPKEAFAQKNVKATDIPARVKRPDALPNKGDREAALGEVPGLSSDVANMDELDRDLLFVRARTKPLKELVKIYPGIEEKKLAKLQQVLGKNAQKNGAKK